jgi:uncharacterized protein YndB with AHSA1/START domain
VRVEESIEIARPPEEVYALVADLERAPEWQASLEWVDVASGTEVRRFAGARREGRFEVAAAEPPRRLEIASRAGPVRARAAFSLAETGGGTRVDFALELEPGGAARLAGPLLRVAAAKEARDNLRRLKELLEGP